ncbi:exopolyphosphatase [Nocardioides sp. CFH 31398]|uniref:Ppx/GppA phosphatase family protein n=1 Tax=Nocardioides sp. CFH 31398 TaxID=2919579 RepID=UPI001F057F27|nr:exopolyphosphatase [Nocardioides sp. CFH 31398]MCH1865835.1 exopolyphosphatase [Nocardioides sp. CFH 31398]
MRVAAVDCGTNTVRLLVRDEDGVVLRVGRIVRLGEGVDATGRLAPAALGRLFAALDEYATLVADAGVERVRFCATSAVRDAAGDDDRAALAVGVRDRLGVEPDVLDGPTEAALTFAGAVAGLPPGTPGPVLVVDIGGGSTELVLGDPARPAEAVGHSADVGAVRLAERHLRTDPPTAGELAACARDVDAALDAARAHGVDPGAARTVVGVAGTVLTLAAGLHGARDLEAVDQAVCDAGDLVALVARVAAMTTAERVATGWIDPGRADVLPAGGVVLERVLARTGSPRLIASVGDILDGIAAEVLRRA